MRAATASNFRCELGRMSDVKFSLLFATHNKHLTFDISHSAPPLSPHHKFLIGLTMTGVNPAIFQDLQARVDEDTAVRDVSGGPQQNT